MNDKWITIVFKDRGTCHYRPDEYTDYRYDGKYFIVIKDKQWIGFYNLDSTMCIEIASIKEAEKGNSYTFYEGNTNGNNSCRCN